VMPYKAEREFAVGAVTRVGLRIARATRAGAVYPYTSPWDMAAVALLTTEAGGRCTALDGTAQRYDDHVRGAIVSNGAIHDDLVNLVGKWTG
jgi:fructose-1,6-bisphosphatase/inositol monophosphatase family enzyme